ncbi:hypothetical protein BDR05DRAFT_114499 [Suillus weaverae]|nr:hypothetical protein BDR05DRAFT_114499 [Suillus weaverae]
MWRSNLSSRPHKPSNIVDERRPATIVFSAHPPLPLSGSQTKLIALSVQKRIINTTTCYHPASFDAPLVSWSLVIGNLFGPTRPSQLTFSSRFRAGAQALVSNWKVLRAFTQNFVTFSLFFLPSITVFECQSYSHLLSQVRHTVSKRINISTIPHNV